MREKWGSDYEKYLSRLREAVADTRGLIMTYEGEPITAYYHSSSNGYTEDVRAVFGSSEPYLLSVPSPDEPSSPSYTTRQTYTFSEAISLVRESCGITLTDPRREISILSRSASGRVSQLQLGSLHVTGVKARSLFSLGSANFEITFSDDQITFTATGHGHGVGMSQYGANAMAASGADYTRILTHYYTGVQLSSAW
jgi:stage II sporulation protein D